MYRDFLSSVAALGGLSAIAVLSAGCTEETGQDACAPPAVVIQSPADGAEFGPSADSDRTAAGFQRDVVVRTTMTAGSQLSLTVTGESPCVTTTPVR